MEGFYVSIIFLGVLLIILSLALIAYDKKKAIDDSKTLSEKKREMELILSDAEQMIEEMNKFSDYVVTQMEIKNQELTANLKVFEDQIAKLKEKGVEQINSVHVKVEKPHVNSQINIKNDLLIDNLAAMSFNTAEAYKSQAKTREKVIPLNNRYREVLHLAEKGLDKTEIAKKMNIGKGEIELILGMVK